MHEHVHVGLLFHSTNVKSQVLSWNPGYDELCISSVPLREQRKSASQRMIVCHDMMGGYINDKFVQGNR